MAVYSNTDPDIESCGKYIERALSNPHGPGIRIRIEEGNQSVDTTTNDPLMLRAILAVLPKLEKYDALVEVSEKEGVRITVPNDLPSMPGTGVYLQMDTAARGKKTNLTYILRGVQPASQPSLFEQPERQAGDELTLEQMQADLERLVSEL